MNYTTDEVYFLELELNAVRYYRNFVFFRCPETETIKEFVELAKYLNKTVVYDIDDLVIQNIQTRLNMSQRYRQKKNKPMMPM